MQFVKIKSIARNEQPEPVYDIQVKKNHNFFANDMIVHNCIIFQETIMKLCSHVAGFPEKETDDVRRSIMKRKASEAAESLAEARAIKERFVAGAVKNGVDEKLADNLYEKILYFSGYGFAKSHAVAYAIDSYYCAWLLTYYEAEWLCAYLEAMSSNDKNRAKSFGEAKELGYRVVPIDINYATKKWTILEGKRLMPSLLSCKGVGEAAIDELISCRPYKNIEDFLWDENGKWRHSKFNKKALEALISVRAFESMEITGEGKVFENYKQMNEILINRNSEIKKSTTKDPDMGKRKFKEALIETSGIGEWTRLELIENSVKYFGSFNTSILVNEETQDRLLKKGIRCIDDVEEEDLYWFLVLETKKKLTKNKKPYLLIIATGLEGKNESIFCWDWDGQTELSKYTLCVGELKKTDFGMQTKMSKVKILKN
jgi:DNA polymerase III alpha subunit